MAKGPVKYFVVDAFTDSAFKGNPAAVCLLEEERDEEWLQSVATEFNVSETCYLTRIANPDSATLRFRLRWFTPVTEVELCGHATLASAHILFTTGLVNSDIIEFDTLSGILTAKKVVLPSGKDVMELQPRFDAIQKCPGDGLIVSGIAAPESGFDFISRAFFPKLGINEDPVNGSGHCALTPYWSQKLGKCDFIAYVASPRGGILNIHLDEQNQRVFLRGKAVTVMEGCILV
ncbi:hypothetical protein SLEP1_g1126 [Rubroshorea leprosula]|uniref:Uncharacterized protein n=1 Tax=Rubroshorea leprosula TaxID=152421 RepID=A0AAV5HLW5_9ROSI|nr:hypothetical protein SLEP1_g1126 [Rubroshorea leprosula]